MTESELLEWAQKSAARIFDGASKCHLAHAVQAVENEVAKHFEGESFAIQILLKDPHRVEGRSILYLFRQKSRAQIWVKNSLAFEEQRKAIAHELGHILYLFHRLGSGQGMTQRAEWDDEVACKQFEVWLCAFLHRFYTTTDFAAKSQFPSLQEFCDQNSEVLDIRVRQHEVRK